MNIVGISNLIALGSWILGSLPGCGAKTALEIEPSETCENRRLLLDEAGDRPALIYDTGAYLACWQRYDEEERGLLVCERITEEGSTSEIVASATSIDQDYFFDINMAWQGISWISAERGFFDSQVNFAALGNVQFVPLRSSNPVFSVRLGYGGEQYLLCAQARVTDCRTISFDGTISEAIHPLPSEGVSGVSQPIYNGHGWDICLSRWVDFEGETITCLPLNENGEVEGSERAIVNYSYPFEAVPPSPNLIMLGAGYGIFWSSAIEPTNFLGLYYVRLNNNLERITDPVLVVASTQENNHIRWGNSVSNVAWTGDELGILTLETSNEPPRQGIGSVRITRITESGSIIDEDVVTEYGNDNFSIVWNRSLSSYGMVWQDYSNGEDTPSQIYFQQYCTF